MLNTLKILLCVSFLITAIVARKYDSASSSEESGVSLSAREYEALVSTAQRGRLAEIILQHMTKSDSQDEEAAAAAATYEAIHEEPTLKHKRFSRYQTGSTRSRAKLLQELREKIHGERRG